MGSRIKSIAIVLVVIAVSVCIICFFVGVGKYSEDKDYIEYATVYGGAYGYSTLQKAGDNAYAGKLMMKYGGWGIVASIIGGLPLYWFGCLFECVENIQQVVKENERRLQELQNRYNKSPDAQTANANETNADIASYLPEL